MKQWSAILVLWLLPCLVFAGISDSPVHIIGENLSAHDVIRQIEGRHDIRIVVDAEDHYGYRKDYDHWVTLEQFFVSLKKYYKTYNGVELVVEGGKRGRYYFKPLRPRNRKRHHVTKVDSLKEKRADKKVFELAPLRPALVDLDSMMTEESGSRQLIASPKTEVKGGGFEVSEIIVGNGGTVGGSEVSAIDAGVSPKMVPEDLMNSLNENETNTSVSEVGSLLSVEVIGFKMALPDLPVKPPLILEEKSVPRVVRKFYSPVSSALGIPGRPLLGHLRSAPSLALGAPSLGEDCLVVRLSRARENRSSQWGHAKLNSTVLGLSGSRSLGGGLWTSAGVELENLNWDLNYRGASLDRDRTWVRGFDFAFHYDIPLEAPGLEVRTSLTSRLPALWENDPWMPHQIQGGVHLGVKLDLGEEKSFLFQISGQSLPELRASFLPMESFVPSLDLGWQWMNRHGLWGVSAHTQRDAASELGFSDPITLGFHWAHPKPELPYGAALYFAAVEGGLEGQLTLSWNLKKASK